MVGRQIVVPPSTFIPDGNTVSFRDREDTTRQFSTSSATLKISDKISSPKGKHIYTYIYTYTRFSRRFTIETTINEISEIFPNVSFFSSLFFLFFFIFSPTNGG